MSDALGLSPGGVRQWQSALLPEHCSLHDAIRNLNASALKIALLTSAGGALVGTVTDGDIRRGLLAGASLDGPAMSVAKRDPIVVPPDVSRDMVLRLMQINRFDAVPVVDGTRQVVGLHLLNDLLTAPRRSNVMVIMAGGRGSRLGAHTENCPKPMLPVSGKPMLEHIIEAAAAEGFHRFVIAVHYLGHMIEDYFGTGEPWKVSIEYLRETTPLGTAGALSLLNPEPDESFVVSNGDVLTDIRYGELLDFHSRHQASATMAVRVHEWQHPFGVVHSRGVDIVGFEEKPIARSHINAGIYALDPVALQSVALNEPMDMPTLFERLRHASRRTIVYPMHEPWLDVGRVDDLQRARQGGDGGKPR